MRRGALTVRVAALNVGVRAPNVRAISAAEYVVFKKWRQKRMNVSFEYAKTLCGEGSVLLLLSLVPYVGWVLGIVGVVLLLRGMKELSSYYQDDTLYRDTWTGVKYLIIAIVSAAVASAAAIIGVWSATGFNFTTATFAPTTGFWVGIAVTLAGLVAAFVFYILAALHLRKMFDSMAKKTGEASFATAGTLLWVGALLTIIVVGLVLIFVAWIFATIGFFTMKSRQHQQYQSGGATAFPSPTQPTTQAPNTAEGVGI
jgi:uncharacterized membrane protein